MRVLINLVRIYPIICNIWILLCMVGQIFYIDISEKTYTFFGQSFFTNAIILLLSYKFRFCLWHRILIYSMTFTLFTETLNIWGIENNYYFYIVLIFVLLSIVLSIILYKINGCFKTMATGKSFRNDN